MRPLTLVPHTHWDREWYLPFEAFRERLVTVMDELLDLLDGGYPHFHLDGQTALVDDYLAVRPEREDDIRRHARTGRVSVGPWLALVDEFLVSGETIVRSLEMGLARARELGGGDLVGYLPDQFGHVGQMPQLLRAAGIDRAVVWRGVPRSVERSAFWWESPDGSRVLAEYLHRGYSVGWNLPEAKEPEALAARLDELAGELSEMSARERAVVMAGMDHAAADPTLPERLAAARRLRPGLDAEIGSLAAYLELPVEDGVPSWSGELRSAARAHLLPGTYSTRIHQKAERGRIEALVERYAEPLAALVPGFDWPASELDRIWRLLVLNGAHDSVCGCSVDEVAHAVDARHTEARERTEEIARAALETLGERVSESGILRFNPSPFERDGVPGLGWRVASGDDEAALAPVDLDVRDGWVVADGVELRFADEADVGDLYNFCPAPDGAVAAPDLALDGAEVVASFDGLEVRLRGWRRHGDQALRLGVVVDNERPDHRLRLHVQLPHGVDEVVAGAPFELVRRPLVSEGSDLEAPSPTWPARGVVLAGDLAVLAEGVLEYEVVDGRELAVTILRCVGTISRTGLATRPNSAGPDIPTPEAQMIGRTELALGIVRDARPESVLEAWERFALPLRSTPARGGGTLPSSGSLLELEGAALSSIRAYRDGLDVRVWNPSAAPCRARIGDETVTLGPAAIATTSSRPTGTPARMIGGDATR
jgi:alpha-mannosidase